MKTYSEECNEWMDKQRKESDRRIAQLHKNFEQKDLVAWLIIIIALIFIGFMAKYVVYLR